MLDLRVSSGTDSMVIEPFGRRSDRETWAVSVRIPSLFTLRFL